MKWKGDTMECEEGPEYLEINLYMIMLSEYLVEQDRYSQLSDRLCHIQRRLLQFGSCGNIYVREVLHIHIPSWVVVLCRCLT